LWKVATEALLELDVATSAARKVLKKKYLNGRTSKAVNMG
jgi:hypothetical protein